MMAVAVSNIGWAAGHDDDAAPWLREAGIMAIEVAPGRLFADVAAATTDAARAQARIWHDRGLPIVSMQALLFGRADLTLFAGPEGSRDFTDYLSHVIGLAGALGCGPLVFGSPRNRLKAPRGFAEALTEALPAFRLLGDVCAAHGTVLCLEANAEAYGCDFMTRLDEAASVVRAVGHPAVGLVADTGNMLMADEPVSALVPVLDLIRHVHVSAPRLGPVRDHAPYVRDILALLGNAGYAGHVTLEMLPPGEGPQALEKLADTAAWLVETARTG